MHSGCDDIFYVAGYLENGVLLVVLELRLCVVTELNENLTPTNY